MYIYIEKLNYHHLPPIYAKDILQHWIHDVLIIACFPHGFVAEFHHNSLNIAVIIKPFRGKKKTVNSIIVPVTPHWGSYILVYPAGWMDELMLHLTRKNG